MKILVKYFKNNPCLQIQLHYDTILPIASVIFLNKKPFNYKGIKIDSIFRYYLLYNRTYIKKLYMYDNTIRIHLRKIKFFTNKQLNQIIKNAN